MSILGDFQNSTVQQPEQSALALKLSLLGENSCARNIQRCLQPNSFSFSVTVCQFLSLSSSTTVGQACGPESLHDSHVIMPFNPFFPLPCGQIFTFHNSKHPVGPSSDIGNSWDNQQS